MTTPQTPPERLQKVLARAGLGSRRACEELIRSGRVRVNGRRAELGMRVDPASDIVEVDGAPVGLDPQLTYLALHKPVGYVSTARDTRGRPTVLDLVPPKPRVAPVGRLDLDTSGLLLLTNDGDFANHVTHPRYGIAKTYVAEVSGKIPNTGVRALRQGLDLDDGPARAEEVHIKDAYGGRTIVELVVREGRNRLVRRMLFAVGCEVVSLTRTAIGPIRLGRLKAGKWRELGRRDVVALLGSGDPSPS